MIKIGFVEYIVIFIILGITIQIAMDVSRIKHQVNEVICVALEMESND